MTLLKLTFDTGSVEVVMEDERAWVRATDVSDSRDLVLPEAEWTYVGVSWRRADGRLLLRVRYEDGEVEQESTLGFSATNSVTVSD